MHGNFWSTPHRPSAYLRHKTTVGLSRRKGATTLPRRLHKQNQNTMNVGNGKSTRRRGLQQQLLEEQR